MTETGPRVGVVGIEGGWSSEALADALAERTGFRLLVEMEHVAIDTEKGAIFHDGTDLRSLDGLVLKKMGREYSPHLLDRLEMLRFIAESGVRMFSDPHRVYRLIDRLSCTVTLRQGGIPMPPTVVTEDVEQAVQAVEGYGEAVLKPLYSTKARGMRVVRHTSSRETRREIADFQNQDNPVVYIQKKIDVPDRDLGIVFLDGEHVGTYARVRGEGSWNTTIHDGGRYEPHEPGAETIELARRAVGLFELDFGSVDVVEAAGGPIVFEVSAFGGFRGIWEASGINAAELLADSVLGKLKR